MIRTWIAVAAATIAAGFAFATPAKADLQDILDAGVVRIGVPADVPPFGFIDKDNKPAGLDVDVARMVAEALGVKLELQQITSANRVPYLVTNKLDLVISAMGATPKRALQIDFSAPYSALSIGLFGPKAIKVTGPHDIGDNVIGVARGTTQDITLTKLAPNATIKRFDDDATAASAYLSGQVDLLATANVVAHDLSQKYPSKELESKFIMRLSPTHIGMAHGNPELLQWLNTFVFYNKNNGTLSELSEKWLGQPLPDNFPSM